jgi:hypothetical protein
MEQETVVLERDHVVRRQVEATPLPSRVGRKEAARQALLLWSGIDGSCASSVILASDLFAPDFRCTGPTRPAMTSQPGDALVGTKQGFTERSLSVTHMVEHGDRVISYVRFSGRHTGTYRGHRPSGQLMQADGYVVHRFDANGRIQQEWSVFRWG